MSYAIGARQLGDLNQSVLSNASWDRKFLYCSASVNFVPTLATLFSGCYHIHGLNLRMRGVDLPLRRGTSCGLF